MITFTVNFLAVLIAAILSMVIGFIWYSKYLFANVWSKQTGVKMEQNQKGTAKSMFVAFLASLITSYILAVLIKSIGATTIASDIGVAVISWIGFVVSYQMVRTAFEKTSTVFFLEEIGHYLVVFLVMAIIFVIMP